MAFDPVDSITRTFSQLKGRYVRSLRVGFLWYFLPTVIVTALAMLAFPQLADPQAPVESLGWAASIASIVHVLILVIAGLIYTGALLRIRTRKPSEEVSFSEGASLAAPLLGVQILQVLALVALMIVPALLIKSGVQTLGVILAFLAVFAYIALIIYWIVSYVELAKGSGVVTSLSESFSLVRGSWWRVFAAVLLMVLIFAIPYIAFMVFLVLVSLLSLIAPVTGSILSTLVGAAFTLLVSPVIISFLVSVHEGLVNRS